MKNILHVIETGGPGGAETIYVELASGLESRRFHSHCAVISEGWVADSLRSREIAPRMVRTRRGRFDYPFLSDLAVLVKRYDIDLIQSHLFGANIYSSIVGRLLRVPVFCTFHGVVDIGMRNRLTTMKLRTVSAGSHTIFVSNALRESFSDVSAHFEDAVVIHNGVNTDLFAPRPSRALRDELSLPADAIIVGAIGNIRMAKNYGLLLQVAAACMADDRIHFVIAGDHSPELSPTLQSMAHDLGIGERVRFLGFRADVGPLLNDFDVYLNTSSSEGFSLSTVQAMSCGIPPIATRSGGPDEIITNGVDGVLCELGDTDGIVTALRRLISDPVLRKTMGEAGRRTAISRFSLGRMVDSYASLYQDTGRAARMSAVR